MRVQMQLDIVGGGSLGLLFGAKLRAAGADVTIWTRRPQQASILLEQGLQLIEHQETVKQRVHVGSRWLMGTDQHLERSKLAAGQAYRYILLTVKQTDIDDDLLERLAILAKSREGERTIVICLQNGIGHLEQVSSKLPNTIVLAAVTTEGARRIDDRTVIHTGNGQLWIGEWQAALPRDDEPIINSIKKLITVLEIAGFTSFLSNQMFNRMNQKLLTNAVINPLTALFDVTNGELPDHPVRMSLMMALYEETEQILRLSGASLEDNSWELILEVCNNTSSNVSSMLSDVRACRRTEINAINGGIVRIAKQHHTSAPLNQAICELVEALNSNPNRKE